ncbi:MAG: transposase [Candidatus Taylorbacteria bacterium]|nr:transposase [Candidatus Taylorbacteria bacterium]
MNRKFVFSVGEYYHVFTRGIDKCVVFGDTADFERFQTLLYVANSEKSIHLSTLPEDMDPYEMDRGETLTDIGCYAEMPNHPHLLLKEKKENGISKFLGKLLTGYSMYFNTKNKRSGSLFVRPYKAEHANTDVYLKYLFAYITLNPLSLKFPSWKENGLFDLEKARIFLQNYKYGSCPDLLGQTLKRSPFGNERSINSRSGFYIWHGRRQFSQCRDLKAESWR